MDANITAIAMRAQLRAKRKTVCKRTTSDDEINFAGTVSHFEKRNGRASAVRQFKT
jgi:hypothetical protein